MPALARTPHPFDTDVDVSSIRFWSQPFDERDRAFARLRDTRPVSWHPPLETPQLDPRHREAGFWAVTTAEHITAVSRDSARFSSAVGQVAVRPAPFRLAPNMLVTDPPDHALFRGPLAAAFSPAGLRRLAPRIERAVRQTVLRSTFRSAFDLVTDVAAPVPARVLAILLGVPETEVPRFLVAVDAFASAGVPAGLVDERAIRAWLADQSAYLTALLHDLERLRRQRPADDLISLLVADGWSATPAAGRRDLVSTALLLIVAGHDTMKQLIALGVLALLQHPDQLRWLLEDLDARFDAAFDELVRWTSPVLSFARTATVDTTLGGAQVAAGDKVALFYCSGNRDAAVFPDPGRLLLSRTPNRHVGFGGGGVHFCLGGALARMQLRAVLATLLTRAPDLRPGVPVLGFNDAVHRVESVPVRRP